MIDIWSIFKKNQIFDLNLENKFSELSFDVHNVYVAQKTKSLGFLIDLDHFGDLQRP